MLSSCKLLKRFSADQIFLISTRSELNLNNNCLKHELQELLSAIILLSPHPPPNRSLRPSFLKIHRSVWANTTTINFFSKTLCLTPIVMWRKNLFVGFVSIPFSTMTNDNFVEQDGRKNPRGIFIAQEIYPGKRLVFGFDFPPRQTRMSRTFLYIWHWSKRLFSAFS